MEWRSMSQEEMDQCWKKLAENGGRSSGQVQGRGQQNRGLQRQRPAGMEACTKQQKSGNISALFVRLCLNSLQFERNRYVERFIVDSVQWDTSQFGRPVQILGGTSTAGFGE